MKKCGNPDIDNRKLDEIDIKGQFTLCVFTAALSHTRKNNADTMGFCRTFKKCTTMRSAATAACPWYASFAFLFSRIGMRVLVEIHVN